MDVLKAFEEVFHSGSESLLFGSECISSSPEVIYKGSHGVCTSAIKKGLRTFEGFHQGSTRVLLGLTRLEACSLGTCIFSSRLPLGSVELGIVAKLFRHLPQKQSAFRVLLPHCYSHPH